MLFQGIFLSLLQCPKAKIYNLINFLKEILHSLGAHAKHSSSWTWKMRQGLDMKARGSQLYPGKYREVSTMRTLPRKLHGVLEALCHRSWACPKPGRKGERIGLAGHADVGEPEDII